MLRDTLRWSCCRSRGRGEERTSCCVIVTSSALAQMLIAHPKDTASGRTPCASCTCHLVTAGQLSVMPRMNSRHGDVSRHARSLPGTRRFYRPAAPSTSQD